MGSARGSGLRDREEGEGTSDDGGAGLMGKFIVTGPVLEVRSGYAGRDLEFEDPFDDAVMGISPDTGVGSRDIGLDDWASPRSSDLFEGDGCGMR